jgi:hypothetical protein
MEKAELKLEVGNRYLIDTQEILYKKLKLTEIEVLEISPSNVYVKIKYPSNCICWELISEIKVIEQLENQNTIPY